MDHWYERYDLNNVDYLFCFFVIFALFLNRIRLLCFDALTEMNETQRNRRFSGFSAGLNAPHNWYARMVLPLVDVPVFHPLPGEGAPQNDYGHIEFEFHSLQVNFVIPDNPFLLQQPND